MFKLIVSDIDGTLVGHDLQISPRVKAAIAAAQAKGVTVTLATGRGAEPTERFAAEVGITAPLVCLQGGQVFDPITKRTLYEARLAPEILPWIDRVATERGWHLHFETPRMVYLPEGVPSPEVLNDLFSVTATKRVSNFVAEVTEIPSKFLIAVHDPRERDEIMETLRELIGRAGLPVQLMVSHLQFVEGVPPGVHKASGLQWLITYLEIAPSEVLAIGDNDNDVTMLRWAQTGVAMGNASPAALAVADWVAPSVEEDGVAVAIEKFVLNGGD